MLTSSSERQLILVVSPAPSIEEFPDGEQFVKYVFLSPDLRGTEIKRRDPDRSGSTSSFSSSLLPDE